MNRKINIVEDLEGKKTVFIQDVIFKGKKGFDWGEVKEYLKRYIGEIFYVAETGDVIYIGKDLPTEYVGSVYTSKLRGTNKKAKANAAQGIPEMIEIATNRSFEENKKEKHKRDARYGWYRYDTRFAIAVFDDNFEISNVCS